MQYRSLLQSIGIAFILLMTHAAWSGPLVGGGGAVQLIEHCTSSRYELTITLKNGRVMRAGLRQLSDGVVVSGMIIEKQTPQDARFSSYFVSKGDGGQAFQFGMLQDPLKGILVHDRLMSGAVVVDEKMQCEEMP